MPGILYVVATPIGNLEDLTFRARRVLGEVDLVAAEDTRRTLKLLTHYEIRKPLVSLHAHNEFREAPRLVEKLIAGQSIAVVSDAGTPGIADPGATLVRAARNARISVVPVPGASAIAAALSVSGIEESPFTFLGFPPPKGAQRTAWFEELAAERRTVIFFEAPHRIARTVGDLNAILAKRQIMCFREISKLHEEYVESPNILKTIKDHGEFTVVVAGTKTGVEKIGRADDTENTALIGQMIDIAGISSDKALAMVSAFSGVPIRSLAKSLKKARILAKRQNQ